MHEAEKLIQEILITTGRGRLVTLELNVIQKGGVLS